MHSHLGCLNPHIHTIGFANFMYWLAKSSLLLVKPLIATDIPELTRLDPPIPIVSHDFHSSIGFCGYPLVNIQKNWWENHHFQWVNPLWMAMFNSYVSHYQRVSPMFRATLIFSPWKKIAENYLSHKQISCLGSNAPCFTILQVIYHWLVVSTPLKRDDYSQYMENKKCSKPPTRSPLYITIASPLYQCCFFCDCTVNICTVNITYTVPPCFQWYITHYKPDYHHITMFVGMDTIYTINIRKYP